MFAAFPANTDFLSSHLSVVVGIGLAFCIFQITLCARLYLRARRRESALLKLCGEFEQFGEGRSDHRTAHEAFPWIHWVLSIFPEDATSFSGAYTRDDVLRELDDRIAGDSDYLLLQRLGVMAPLLGVILTVVGFYWLDIDESVEQSLQSMLLAVTPLVIGVGTGAVLAIINQVLLHIVGKRIERLRLAGRFWFDTVIWSCVGLESQTSTLSAVAAIERYARSVGDSADRHAVSSDRLDQATLSLKESASLFNGIARTFGDKIKAIPETLSEVQGATAAAAEALRELIPIGARAVANLDVSVAAFRSTIDSEFTNAAKLHDRSSKALAQAVQQIGDSTERLKSGCNELKRTSELNTASFKTMDESLREHLVPGHRHLYDAVQGLTGPLADLNKLVSVLVYNVDATTRKLETVMSGLAPSISSFRDVVDNQFGPVVSQHRNQVESVGQFMSNMQSTAENMSEGMNALNSLLRECSRLLHDADASHEALADVSKGLMSAGSDLRHSVVSDIAPSQRTMQEAATSFARSAAKFASFIEQGLVPATAQLNTIHQTLSGLESAVNSIKSFSQARSDLDRLTETLARAAEISDAITSLPEQIRDIVEQNADCRVVLPASPGGFRRWLAKRPR